MHNWISHVFVYLIILFLLGWSFIINLPSALGVGCDTSGFVDGYFVH
jgi:hypothetical protein